METAIFEATADTVKDAAQDILMSIETISEKADAELTNAGRFHSLQHLVNNTLTGFAAVNKLAGVRSNNISSNEALVAEPAIARVVVKHSDGHKMTYYFCRKGSLVGLEYITLAQLNAPIGRIAALPVGEEYELKDDQYLTVLENIRFTPQNSNQAWDAIKAEFRGEGYAKTIESLRALMSQMGAETVNEDVLADLLNEESDAQIITDGIRRRVIDKMDLRDQPILDQYQDKIFRLPLNSQLLILGAPGTGKTTTLIRRLGQKVDQSFLDDDEKQLLVRANAETGHDRSWIMFTPTDLLKLYVKEAFNRENIPASDERISTWSDFRENLARNMFPVLRSAANNGSLVMKDAAAILVPAAEADLIGLFGDFDQWQSVEFWNELQIDAKRLSDNTAPEIADIGQRILSAIEDFDNKAAPSTFSALAALTASIKEIVDTKKKETDKKLHEALNIQVNKNRAFLDELATFMEGLTEAEEEADDQEAEEDEETDTPRVGRRAAMARYLGVSRSYARVRAQGKQLSKTSSTGRIAEWLGDRIIAENVAKEIGKSLIIQSALRRFVNPVRSYIDKIPTRYRRFRREKQAEGRWYRDDGFAPTDVQPLEVDLILLTILRNTNSLIAGIRRPDEETKKTLDRLQDLYYTQVLVDEATDFSPIQLACMAALSHPRIQSFFACGDFNQRFTSCGVRSIDEVKWAIPQITEERISVTYRHSNQLHRLAQAIIGLSGEAAANVHTSEDYLNENDLAPVLALNTDKEDVLATWLASRIKEIEGFLRKLPSIAVLVNDEETVSSVAKALKPALESNNIQVIPCFNGQVLGRDNGAAVRVFSVEHIKGLEFEAVFFVGIDKLAESHPDLFEKYLYVGATRAATYFGMTCEKNLPEKLKPIEHFFEKDWSGR